MRFLRYEALKSVMGPGRVGPGREYSDFSLKFERTRSVRCARSLVIICIVIFLGHPVLQGRRNVIQSEGASETSILSRVKTNLSTMDFYAYLCFPRPGESFSV